MITYMIIDHLETCLASAQRPPRTATPRSCGARFVSLPERYRGEIHVERHLRRELRVVQCGFRRMQLTRDQDYELVKGLVSNVICKSARLLTFPPKIRVRYPSGLVTFFVHRVKITCRIPTTWVSRPHIRVGTAGLIELEGTRVAARGRGVPLAGHVARHHPTVGLESRATRRPPEDSGLRGTHTSRPW